MNVRCQLFLVLFVYLISFAICGHGFEIRYKKPPAKHSVKKNLLASDQVLNTVNPHSSKNNQEKQNSVIYSNLPSTVSNYYPNNNRHQKDEEEEVTKIEAAENIDRIFDREQSSSSSTEELDSAYNLLRRTTGDIIEYLRTDGNPGTPAVAGISWTALAISFLVLSPILIPLILSPLGLIIGFFLFLPTVISNSMYIDG